MSTRLCTCSRVAGSRWKSHSAVLPDSLSEGKKNHNGDPGAADVATSVALYSLGNLCAQDIGRLDRFFMGGAQVARRNRCEPVAIAAWIPFPFHGYLPYQMMRTPHSKDTVDLEDLRDTGQVEVLQGLRYCIDSFRPPQGQEMIKRRHDICRRECSQALMLAEMLTGRGQFSRCCVHTALALGKLALRYACLLHH